MPYCQPGLQKWENGFLMANEQPETNLEEFKVTMRMIGAPDQPLAEASCPVVSSLDEVIRHSRKRAATNKDAAAVEERAQLLHAGQVSKARLDACHQEHSSGAKSSLEEKEVEESLSEQLSDRS
jgi:hypothetical protein